jgi:hypothetical protein
MNDKLKARIFQATRVTPSPTRRASHVQVWLVMLSSVVAALALFFAFDGAHHGLGRPPWFYAACTLAWSAVAALSMWGAFSRGSSALGRPRSLLLAIAFGTPAVLFTLMFAFAVVFPEVTVIHPERIGLRCLGLTLAAAAFPLLGLTFVRRESDPVHPVTTGAALGAACGASAGVMVEMWCPVATPLHVAVGHVLPIVLLGVFGAILGARVLRMRARPT